MPIKELQNYEKCCDIINKLSETHTETLAEALQSICANYSDAAEFMLKNYSHILQEEDQ